MGPPAGTEVRRVESPLLWRSAPATKPAARSLSPYQGWGTAAATHEDAVDPWMHYTGGTKGPQRWADEGQLYDTQQCPPAGILLGAHNSLSLPAMPAAYRDGTPLFAPSPTSVLQLPYFDSRSTLSSPSPVPQGVARSPSPALLSRALRSVSRSSRMASPLPGGYVATTHPVPHQLLDLPATYSTYFAAATVAPRLPPGASEDDEITQWVTTYKTEHYRAPMAATVIARAWRRYSNTKKLRQFIGMRRPLKLRTLRWAFANWRMEAAARRHASQVIQKHIFGAWRDYCQDLDNLFRTLGERLNASAAHDNVAPVQIWRLGMSEMKDQWSSQCSLTSALIHCAARAMPIKWAKAVVRAWRRAATNKKDVAGLAAAVLRRLVRSMGKEMLHWLFRFWYRYTKIKYSERLGIEPPDPKPQLPEWDEWLWHHTRRQKLMAYAKLTYRHFRLRFCFYWLRWHASRNIKMREAWKFAAQTKIRAMKQLAFKAFRHNAQELRATRHIMHKLIKRWAKLTAHHLHLRRLNRQLIEITHNIIKRKVIARLRKFVKAVKVLRTSMELRLWQNRSLGMQVVLRLRQEWDGLMFIEAWRAWKKYAIGRISFVTFIGHHMVTRSFQMVQAAFHCWKWLAEQGGSSSARSRRICAPPMVVKQFPPPWRRTLTREELLSMVPKAKRTPERQLPGRMRAAVRVDYGKAPYPVIPNRCFRPPSKPLLEIWSLKDSVMLKYQNSEARVGVSIWQRVVSLTIALAAKPTPDWMSLVWEASGRAMARSASVTFSTMEAIMQQDKADQEEAQQGDDSGDDSDADSLDDICRRPGGADEHIRSFKISQRQRLDMSAKGFMSNKTARRLMGLEEVQRAQEKEEVVVEEEAPDSIFEEESSLSLTPMAVGGEGTGEGTDESYKRGFSFRCQSLARHNVVDVAVGKKAQLSLLDGDRDELRQAYAYDLMVETESMFFCEALARAEALMEGKVYVILGAGAEVKLGLDESLRQMYPWSVYEGETYYWFLRNLVLHDEQCYRVDLKTSIARDRVLTSWLTLHQMAVALSAHRPEFTLQDPSMDIFAKWEAAFHYTDSSDGEDSPEKPNAKIIPKRPSLRDKLSFRTNLILQDDAVEECIDLGGAQVLILDDKETRVMEAVRQMALFWRRRVHLRLVLQALQLKTQQKLEEKLVSELQRMKTVGEELTNEVSLTGSVSLDGRARQTVSFSGLKDGERSSDDDDSTESPPTAAEDGPSPAVAADADATVEDSMGHEDSETVAVAVSAVGPAGDMLKLMLGGQDGGELQPRGGTAAGMFGLGGLDRTASAAPSVDFSSDEDEPAGEAVPASPAPLSTEPTPIKAKRESDDLDGMVDLFDNFAKKDRRRSRKARKKKETEVREAEETAARAFGRRRFRTKGVRARPASVFGDELLTAEAKGHRMCWQPTPEEHEYLSFTTPTLMELLEAAGAEERRRLERSAEELVDSFMAAIAEEGKPASEASEEVEEAPPPRRGPVPALERLGARSRDLWVPRMDDIRDVLGAGVDPEALTGFNLQRYSDGMIESMARLVVQPMAARLVFWDRVQRAGELSQLLREDARLEEHLRDLVFGMSFRADAFGSHKERPPPPHAQVLHGRLDRGAAPQLAPLLVGPPAGTPASRQRSRWGAATLHEAAGLRGRHRPASCEPPLLGVPGVADPPALRARAEARRSRSSLGSARGVEGADAATTTTAAERRRELQAYIDERLSTTGGRVDTMRIRQLEEYARESEALAGASLSLYASYAPARHGVAAHRGRELRGWTSPRAHEPPTGRYAAADLEGTVRLRGFGSPERDQGDHPGPWLAAEAEEGEPLWRPGRAEGTEGLPARSPSRPRPGPLSPLRSSTATAALDGRARTLGDTVQTGTTGLQERPLAEKPPCYNREELQLRFIERREREKADQDRFERTMRGHHVRIDEALKARERHRQYINHLERMKQIQIVETRRETEIRRRQLEAEIRRRRIAAEEERRRQLMRGETVEYVGGKKPVPKPKETAVSNRRQSRMSTSYTDQLAAQKSSESVVGHGEDAAANFDYERYMSPALRSVGSLSQEPSAFTLDSTQGGGEDSDGADASPREGDGGQGEGAASDDDDSFAARHDLRDGGSSASLDTPRDGLPVIGEKEELAVDQLDLSIGSLGPFSLRELSALSNSGPRPSSLDQSPY